MCFQIIKDPVFLMLRIKKNVAIYYIFLVVSVFSCTENAKKNMSSAELYQIHCGSCHLAPDPTGLPRDIWKNRVLPEMAARMGYRYNDYNPTQGKSFDEKYHILKSKIYPSKPIIDSLTWWQVHDYIVSLAPDSVPIEKTRSVNYKPLTIFDPKPVFLEKNINPLLTTISFDSLSKSFYVGSGNGNVHQWSPDENNLIESFTSPITSYLKKNGQEITTEIGLMNPSEIPEGIVHSKKANEINVVGYNLHRPVFTDLVDLNDDGRDEVLVCEFGHLTGELSLFEETETKFKKKTLLPLPGAVKFEITDMNNDGRKDIIVLMSQGNEGLFILYQTDNLNFEASQIIKLPPEYGSSWFELIDYNSDGHMDIVMVNGDNADFSIFPKPYHGIRLFLNDTNNQFEQKWFHPIYGATKVLTADYDSDGDLDFVVTAFFADIGNPANEGFHFLENNDSADYKFQEYTFKEPLLGNWLVLDKGDVDSDGDLDLLLGSFKLPTYNPLPKDQEKANISKLWFLENKTKH